jgi:hypothetical protein
MNEYSDPLDYILNCAEQGIVPKLFTIQNAKDELKKLRQKLESFKVVAYGRINTRHDLYGLSINYNPYLDQDTVVPLYSNREEFLKEDWRGYQYGRSTK